MFKLILILIAGIILTAGGGFTGLISPFLTDSGRPEMIRAFYIVLAGSIATVCVGLGIVIWSLIAIFR
jgi:hypothetical protein